ncbi:MAG: amidohydrolase [Opitutae bacterium]|nr:amidohydrolase [Opitutae bacterium]
MIVDAHVHLYPPELNAEPARWAAEHQEPHWAELCTRRRKNGSPVQGFPSVEALLRAMDAAGVARTVLQGWYWQRPENCAAQNRFFAACVRAHPDRLSAFATVHPAAGVDAVLAEMQRARDEGLIGLGELSPHSQDYDVADAIFAAMIEQAGEWRWPVNLHVTDPESGDYPGKVETPLRDFVWLARAYTQTNFILAHWGGLLPLRELEGEELLNVFYDTAASPLLYDATIWTRFLEAVPAGRVLFGSDFPLNVYPKLDAEPGMTRLLEEARAHGADAAVLGENARKLLNLR